jgi:ribose transport system ATP-binding protein
VPGSLRGAIRAGVAFVSGDRRRLGLMLDKSIWENVAQIRAVGLGAAGPVIRAGDLRRRARVQVERLRVRTPSVEQPAGSLSGGNQQKVVVGKWLNHGARLYIFDEPTVGVDVGTKVQIYRVFSDLLREGAGIILISSYLPEVYELSDRLHVFRRGRLVASHGFKDADHETILAEALG